MTGKSYELPHVVTTLGGMVTWVDEHLRVAHGGVRLPGGRARRVLQARSGRRHRLLARLVRLDRRQALDLVSYDVFEIDPAPGEWPFGGGRE